MAIYALSGVVRFGIFEFDTRSRQLSRKGIRIRLPQQPIQVLSVLLERSGEVVTREELRKLLWPADVFVDFDLGLNKSIQKLREALGDSPGSPRFIETIPRFGYRFIAPVITEVASDNLVPQVPAASATINLPGKSKVLWFSLAGCAGMLLLASVWFVARLLHRNTQPPITSLAVLPLDNLSGDPGQEYFADGITDELTTMLAKDSTLRITSRTSVMQYKGARRPLSEIARALNVDAILEGSASHFRDHIHLNLQLIRADTDAHVWAESYDRNDNDAVALPDQAARAIAGKLNSNSPAPAAARAIKPQAHDAYLRGEYLWYQGQNWEAIKEFNLAISLQPDYAAAWSGLASSYGQGADSSQMDPDEALPKAESTAAKALELDPSLADAHLSMGAIIVTYHWDLVRGDREILKAMELDPRFTQAVHFHAMVLAAMNRQAEGVAMQKKASELDPIARPWALPRAYLWARDPDAALNDALPKLKAGPEVGYLNLIVSRVYRAKGMEKEAATYLLKWLLLSCAKDAAPEIERAYHQGGYRALVALQLNQLEKKSRTQYVSPFEVATLNAELGNREKAMTFLQQSFRKRDEELIWVQCDPEFDFLHADPHYRSIIQRMGLPPAY